MSFEDDELDRAYKLLESTEKFCAISRSFSRSKSTTAQQDLVSFHERLCRRTIIADCLLFEAILVFLKQGFTSYVKGGYILRKAWKLYEKIYMEVEQLCQTPSPISLHGASPVDRHIGTSIYDRKDKGSEEEMVHEGVDALTSSLPGLLTEFEEGLEGLEKDLNEVNLDEVEEEDDEEDQTLPTSSDTNGGGGIDDIDTDSKGYCLPDIPNSSIQTLDNDDARLRASLYFGYGLMNVIVSLIPPKLMKVANLFGFHGSRKIGLQALEYASNSQDMKAPLAR